MAGKIIADIIEAPYDKITLNVGNTTVLTANGTGITYVPTSNLNINIGSTANLTLGNVTATSVITNGIKFPATQVASGDANTLDDYEEGTWTAGVAFGGASVGITYSNQGGGYTKIGNLVVCTCLITLTNKGSSSGAATITGLPFSSLPFGAINFAQVSAMTFADVPFGYTSGTTITLQETTNAGGLSNLDNTNFANNTQLIFNAVFRV